MDMGKPLLATLRHSWFRLLIIATGFFLVALPLAAQTPVPDTPPPTTADSTPAPPADVSRLHISRLDVADFPFITVNLLVNGPAGERITNLNGLTLRENGTPVVDFTVDEVAAGLDVLFVLDANADIFNLDDDSGRTRLDKAQDSLIRFGTQFMDPGQLDHASVIVPQGEEVVFLAQDVTRPGDLVDAVEAFTLENAQDTPLQAMMAAALEQAGTTHVAGRYQAIVLLTDGARINSQLAYDDLLAAAGELGLTFHTLILGARADANEVANAALLTEPTSGRIVHMPNAPDADELFALLRDNGTQAQVTYRSTLVNSGDLRLQMNLGTAQDSAETTVTLAPPEVALLPTITTIRRAGTQPDTPLTALQPAVQPLEAQITWPGGQPVSLADAQIMVNGEANDPVESPIVTGDGLLRLDWDISMLDEGTYAVALQLTDALGRTSESAPLAITITVTRPAPPTAATATLSPTSPPAATGMPGIVAQNQTLLLAGMGGLFLLILGLLLLIRRRRRRAKQAEQAAQDAAAVAEAEAAVAAATAAEEQAYLVVLPDGPEAERPIPLAEDDMTIGRDPKLVAIPLADRSISRLHARIRRRKGEYWLYDEGSATGTYLNFNRIGLAPHMLQEGDEVHIGRVHMRFHQSLPARYQEYFTVDDSGDAG
jgi:hypothetical protein